MITPRIPFQDFLTASKVAELSRFLRREDWLTQLTDDGQRRDILVPIGELQFLVNAIDYTGSFDEFFQRFFAALLERYSPSNELALIIFLRYLINEKYNIEGIDAAHKSFYEDVIQQYEKAKQVLAAQTSTSSIISAMMSGKTPVVQRFIGRDVDLKTAANLLGSVRLLLLKGPGGVGKTRLAIALVEYLQDTFSDGICFVDLAAVAGSDLVASRIASKLGIGGDISSPPLTSDNLVKYLYEKELLLVLDNFEKVTEAAPLLWELLEGAKRLKILVTSQQFLGASERVFDVNPLPIPPINTATSLEHLRSYSSIRLFEEYAQQADPSFSLNEVTAPTVAEICRRLDGLPLAIELATAHLYSRTPQELLKSLQESLRIVTSITPRLHTRHESLQAVFNWSYALLDTWEQVLFRRLAPIRGEFTLDLVDVVCNSEKDLEITLDDGLAALVNKSLLRRRNTTTESRYEMLETIREYAAEQLSSSGEQSKIREQHAQVFLELAKAAKAGLAGDDPVKWIQRLEEEYGNLQSALNWCLSNGVITGAELADTLVNFWYMGGYLTDAFHWLDLALKLQTLPTELRVWLLSQAAMFADELADFDSARKNLEESVALCRDQNDLVTLAALLGNLGLLEYSVENYDVAKQHFEEALSLRKDPQIKFPDERSRLLGIAKLSNNLGMIEHMRGESGWEQAYGLYQESLRICKELVIKRDHALVLSNLAELEVERGHYREAINFYETSWPLYQVNKLGIPNWLDGVADLIGRCGNPLLACRLLAVATALRESSDMILSPADTRVHDRRMVAIRQTCDNLWEMERQNAATPRGLWALLQHSKKVIAQLLRALRRSTPPKRTTTSPDPPPPAHLGASYDVRWNDTWAAGKKLSSDLDSIVQAALSEMDSILKQLEKK